MSHQEEQRLRDAVREASGILGDGSDCPEAELLRRSARGELDRPESDEVILHLSGCGACAAAWRVAREMAPEQARARRYSLALAAAAAIVLASSLGLWLFANREPPTPPTYRNQERHWPLSEVSGTSLPREDFTLRWSEGPAGTAYDLRVLRENLDALHHASGLETAFHTVPPEALKGLPAGSRVLWQVTARLPDGSTTVSDTFVTRVE